MKPVKKALIFRRFLGTAAGILAATLIITGCSQKPAASGPKPGSGIAEYRTIAAGAQDAIIAALDELAKIQRQSGNCSDKALSAFSDQVNRLQVESLQVRARSQAMQGRGDAYFANWHENMARVQEPKLRALIESQRPELEGSFGRIKTLSNEGREAFKPFLDELRQIRNELEKNPGNLTSLSTRELMARAWEKGNKVEASLAGIIRELDAMKAGITLPTGSAKRTTT